MAMVEFPRPTMGIRYPGFSSRGQISRAGCEIVEEVETVARTTPSHDFEEDVLFVALGKEMKESESVLMWALHNSRGRRICILHVHQPAQKIPISDLGTKVLISQLKESQVTAYHEDKRKDMVKLLDKYIQTCKRAGVQAEKKCIEMDSIEKGIVKLIYDHDIKSLVIGTTSYSRRTSLPKSRKAIHVRAEAPVSCQISFICKGALIRTRVRNLVRRNVEAELPTPQASPNIGSGLSVSSPSVNEGLMMPSHSQSSSGEHRRVSSDNHVIQISANNDEESTPFNLDPEGNIHRNCSSRRRPSVTSQLSSGSHNEITSGLSGLDLVQSPGSEGSEIQFESPISQQSDNNHHSLSPVDSSAVEENMDNQLYDRLEQFMTEAENSRREAFEKSIRRKKAEKDIIDVIRKIKTYELMYVEELRRREESDEALARGLEELEKIICQLDEIKEELRVAEEHNSLMERRLSDSDGQIPAYFICPISQDIMQDLVVAADGYTYETDAIKGWMDGGHDTSPMTNVKLLNSNLIPNLAIRSEIQEWLQHHDRPEASESQSHSQPSPSL